MTPFSPSPMDLLLYYSVLGTLLIAILSYMTLSLSRADGARPKPLSAASKQLPVNRTEFLGSQVGGESVINYCYTDNPWKLVFWDVKYFFTFAWALPWIIWPVRPCEGGHFDELSLNGPNVKCMILHAILVFLQSTFLLSLPLLFLLPVWVAGAGVAVFLALNNLLCMGLNGKTITFESDPKYAPELEKHAHEQWIFLNGVAVGETWLMANINRLALTFKRPIIGVHNRTKGIIFDVIECMVQRNFGHATGDVRAAYKIIKEKLYNPQYTKVIFILHSQGGIEGGLVLDWLLQELPQDLLTKLEVYTFGNASNHFNNPHRRVDGQQAQKKDPGNIVSERPLTDSPAPTRASTVKSIVTNGDGTGPDKAPPRSQSSAYTVSLSDRAIAHVEHYAHTTDFVALWGILHFVTNERASASMPRYIGRVFRRTSSRGGHQFCQHYLNGMFPLACDAGGAFIGCAEKNEFMDSVVEIAKEGTEKDDIREGAEVNWALIEGGWEGVEVGKGDEAKEKEAAGEDYRMSEVMIHGSFAETDRIKDGKVRVKNLSRLWQYRNGRSPFEIPRQIL